MQSVYPAPALWAQLLTALMIGLLTTVAFQFLLTSLGVALGISVLSLRPTPVTAVDGANLAASTAPESKPLLQLDSMVGLGILGTVNLGLFAACFLAARFSQLHGPAEGAIAGITIWSAYLLLVLWVSAQTANAAVSFLLDRATGGLRKVVGAIAQFFQPAEAVPLTADDLTESVRQEIQAALQSAELRTLMREQLQAMTPSASLLGLAPPVTSPSDIDPVTSTQLLWEPLTSYLAQAKARSLTPKKVDYQLQKILQADPRTAANIFPLTSRDLTLLSQHLDQRDDLSEKRKQRILHQIEETWQQLQKEPSQAPEPPQPESSELPQAPSLATTLWSSAVDVALEQVVETVVANVRDGSLGSLRPLESVQSAIAQQVDTLQNQVQSQAEATRRVAVKAAWWLFATASTGAISAAIAGALATGLKLPAFPSL